MITLFELHKINKKQGEVDFLIPFLDLDRRYCLDPALLRFSKNKRLKPWADELEYFLKLVHQIMKRGDIVKLEKVLNIGEAPDAGLGYCENKVTGSGVGKEISRQVIRILTTNPDFKSRGFLRIEELQWMDKNIGPDRISDLVINILKRNIIQYTKLHAKKSGIPVEKVRVQKIFNPDTLEWISEIHELPINPKRLVRDGFNPHPPLLLIPKELIRPLPLFLSYDDFYGFIDPEYRRGESFRESKPSVVKKVIDNPDISKEFIKDKETKTDRLYRSDFNNDIQKKIIELENIPVGSQAHASKYRDVVSEIIEFLFEDLVLFKKEKQTLLGTSRKDLLFQNKATSGILFDLKNKYDSTVIVVDTKNTNDVTAKDVAQVANYLDDDIGRIAFIVSRSKDEKLKKHAYVQLTKHKKVIFFISDEDLKRWVTDSTRIQHVTGKHLSIAPPLKSIENMYTDLVSD